jgi:protein farnesyltransferase subunit beta
MDKKEIFKQDNPNYNRTIREQLGVENKIENIFKSKGFDIKHPEKFDLDFQFNGELHFNFANRMIISLPEPYSSIDAGLPWFSYWVLNILEMCNYNKYDLSHIQKMKFLDYLRELQHPDGGFSGYSKGLPHMVSNYAAVMSILNLGIKEGYDLIDKEKMKSFFKKMKNNELIKNTGTYDETGSFLINRNSSDKFSKFSANWPGSFQMHENGESDLRATYCCLSVAFILNLIDDELIEGVIENIKLCQTFEGGLGPEPFCEAHGGYSYCGIATLVLLNKLNEIDIDRFILWIVNKQMTKEGGFQGRTNKLVDSCYSFWQGSVFNMLIMNGNDKKYSFDHELIYDQLALQAYILFCCQNQTGGLIDKPGKYPDLFHTNYASAGLSLSQKCLIKDNKEDYKVTLSYSDTLDLKEMNPIYCITQDKLDLAKNYFWGVQNE